MPIYPAGQGVNGLLYPRFLLGCVWLSPSYALPSLALASCLWYRLQVRQKCDNSTKYEKIIHDTENKK